MKHTFTAMLSTALLMFSGQARAGIVPQPINKPISQRVVKPLIVMIGLMTLFAAPNANAAGSNIVTFEQWAQIVNVEAVWKIDTSSRMMNNNHCTQHSSTTYHGDDHNPSNEILGAIIGGVVGNQLGKGSSNRNVTTIIGAIGGGAIANKMENGHTHNQDVTVCQPQRRVENRRTVDHYIVTYSLNGKQFIMHEYQKPRHMEKKVTVTVQVTYRGLGE